MFLHLSFEVYCFPFCDFVGFVSSFGLLCFVLLRFGQVCLVVLMFNDKASKSVCLMAFFFWGGGGEGRVRADKWICTLTALFDGQFVWLLWVSWSIDVVL